MAGVPDADLSVCGPLARDPRDLRLAMQIMAHLRATGGGLAIEFTRVLSESLRGLKVAVWASDDMAGKQDTEQRLTGSRCAGSF